MRPLVYLALSQVEEHLAKGSSIDHQEPRARGSVSVSENLQGPWTVLAHVGRAACPLDITQESNWRNQLGIANLHIYSGSLVMPLHTLGNLAGKDVVEMEMEVGAGIGGT